MTAEGGGRGFGRGYMGMKIPFKEKEPSEDYNMHSEA